jgi:sugar (pentulose or hexulose) kinase
VGFYGLGEFESMVEASERLTRMQRSFVPQPENRGLYDDLYGAFKTACTDLAPTHKKLIGE